MSVLYESEEKLLTPEQINVACDNPEQLKRYLEKAGNKFIVFKHDDLVDALPWPGGIEFIQQAVVAYRQFRAQTVVEDTICSECNGTSDMMSGRRCMNCASSGRYVRTKSDRLELDELKECVQYLLAQVRKKDPTWSP